MKRLVFFLSAILTAGVISAKVSIPQNFNGIQLGSSTRNEVDRILTSNNLVFSAEDSDTTNIVYQGTFRHEDMDFESIILRFQMDTVVFIGFVAKCDSACSDFARPFIQHIHTKYDALAYPDSSLSYSLITSDADSLHFEKWGRKDDNSLIITMHNDAVCICVYFAEKRSQEMMTDMLFRLYLSSNPNFSDENKVYGVAGVKFGDSMESVRKIISSKADKLLESDSHSLTYSKVKIGGMTYDYALFYFSGTQGLVSVNMQNSFYSWQKEEALLAFESVKSQYSRKYTNFSVIEDKVDEKVCTCGAYIDGYDYVPIIITFQKSLSRGGDIMYYVQVDYYHARRNGMYDDEI